MLATLLFAAPNLIFNASFSLGDVGFESGYVSAKPTYNALYPERVYTVVANMAHPIVLNSAGVADYYDHTTGRANGAFLTVNGSLDPNSLAWGQEVTGLEAGRTYEFAVWTSRWTPNAVLHSSYRLVAGGKTLTTFEDPSEAGVWVRHAGTFVAEGSTIRLQIRALSEWVVGNDFGLDDLSLRIVS